MTSHLLSLLLFAALVSSVFAALTRDEPRTQLRTAGLMFAGFVVAGIALSWLMYPLPL